MKAKGFFELLKDAWKEWGEDKASRLGAALAYYTIFAIGPVLVLLIAIMGFVLGAEAAQGRIVGQVEGAVGREAAVLIEGMVKAASSQGTGIIATVFGTAGLLLGAVGIVGQLKDALNTIWDVEPQKKSFLDTIKANLWSFVVVAGAGLLLLTSVGLSAVIGAVDNWSGGSIPGGALLWRILNYAVTFAVLVAMFAMIYKVLPDAKIAWRDVWPGAAITAALFVLGQLAIGLYMSFTDVGSPFGAASALVIILVWIYYSAQIIFFGAELTKAYADRYGVTEPEESARRVTSGERAEQGLASEPKESPWFK